MGNKLLKSILLLILITLLNSIKTEAAARLSIADGDWNDANTWFLGLIPNTGDQIIISHNVTLNGNMTLTTGGSISVISTGQLSVHNVINHGTITIFGNGKFLFNKINNNTEGIIDNFGYLNGNEILNVFSGEITIQTSATLLLSDKIANNGTFTNKPRALSNIAHVHNTGTFTNEGLIRGAALNNNRGGDFTNSARIEMEHLHNGENENDFNNASGMLTNEITGNIILSDHAENYNGRLLNLGIIRAENYFDNFDRLLIAPNGKLFVKGDFKNNAPDANGNEGKLTLYGVIHLGENLLHLDAIPGSGGNKQFTNNGSIIGNGKGGIYAKEDDTFVENNGDITIGPEEVFLCIGTPSNYNNNGTGDFTQDCCFLLTADAGEDGTFCVGGLDALAAGGSPTASMGIRPYDYDWTPYTYISDNGSNPNISPQVVAIEYTVTITDDNGCVATDQIVATPSNNPIAHAGDNNSTSPICPGDVITLGASPAASCGAEGYSYEWRKSTNLYLTIISTLPNPTVNPSKTTTYQLTITDAGSVTAQDEVTIFVNSDVNANAGGDAIACGNSYQLQGVLGNGQSGTWSTTSGTGMASDPSNPRSDVTGLINGAATTLKWTVTGANSCNASDEVTITGGGVTQATITNPTDVVCATTFPAPYGILDGNLVNLGETGQWVIDPSSTTTATIVNNNSPFSNLKNITSTGVLKLKWTITDGSCTTESATKTITINENPTANAGTDDTATGTSYTMQADALGANETGLWTVVTNIGGVTTGDLTDPNMVISGTNASDIITLTWSVTNTITSCSTTSSEVTITGAACSVTQATVANPMGTNCINIFPVTPALDGNTPGVGETGKWVVEATSTAVATIADESNPTSNIEITTPGVLDLTWTITDGGSCSSTATKQITAVKTEYTTVATSESCLKIGDNFPLDIAAAGFKGGAPGEWSFTLSSGSADNFSFDGVKTVNNNKFIITNITGFPIEGDLKWTVDQAGCTNTYKIPIQINELPTVDPGANATICSNTYTMQGTLNAGETGAWTQTGGTAVTMGVDTDPNMTITGLTAGEVITMNWTVTNTATLCENNKKVDITTQTAIAPVSGAAINECANLNDTPIIQLTNAPSLNAGETGQWTFTLTDGGADNFAFSNDSQPNSEFKVYDITALPYIGKLRWTVIKSGVCDAVLEQILTINEYPTVPTGADLELNCANPTVNIGTGLPEADVIYNWSTVGGNFVTVSDQLNVDVDQPGNYTLEAKNVTTGCVDTKTINVTRNTAVPIANAGSDVTNCDGNFVLQGSALGANESGLWTIESGGSPSFVGGINTTSNATLTGLMDGDIVTMRWTVTNDITSCSNFDDVIISELITAALVELPAIDKCNAGTIELFDLGTDVPALTGTETGKWTFTLTNGTVNLNFSSSIDDVPNAQLKAANITGYPVVVDLTWTVRDAGVCDKLYTKKITIKQEPSANPGPAQIIDCINADATIGAGAAQVGYTYEWKNSTDDIVGTDLQITVSIADTYTLRVTNSNGGCVSPASSVTVTNTGTLPIADAGTDKVIDCGNTSVTIGTSTAALANHTYTWTTTDGNFVGVSNQINVNVNQAGTYILTVTNTTTGCISLPVDITVTGSTTLPTADAGTAQKINCTNSAVTIGTGTAQTGFSYEWTTVDGHIVGATNNITATADQAGTYTLKVTNGATTCFATDDVVVTADITLPIADAGTAQKINCTNSAVTIGTGTAQTGFSYEWTTVDGNIVGATNNITATADQAGTYTLKVINDATTCFATDDVTVTTDITLPIADAGTAQTLCDQLSTTLDATLPSGSTGLWEVVNGTVNIVSASLPNTAINNLLPNTTVTLKWTENNGCGTDSKTITVTNSTAPTASNAGPAQTLCDGTTNATLEGNTPTSGSGVWTVVSGPAVLSDEFFTNSTITITGLTDGSTSVLKWTISNGTCPISESEVTIKVLEPKAIEKSEFQICDGESVQLAASGGISYTWSPAEGLSSTNIANPIASPTIPTLYTVIIDGGGTCGSTAKEVKVNVIANPIVTITEGATINIGERMDLLATGGTGYSWTPADGLDNASIANPVAKPRKTTTYVVTVSNIEGCAAEASVTINVKEDFQIFVPQMFEPNSSTNNIVKVNTIGIKNVVFKIYNRTNKEIFSTSDASIGWDGKHNGTVQNMDTYVYVVIAETYAGTKITRQGSIQLVR